MVELLKEKQDKKCWMCGERQPVENLGRCSFCRENKCISCSGKIVYLKRKQNRIAICSNYKCFGNIKLPVENWEVAK